MAVRFQTAKLRYRCALISGVTGSSPVTTAWGEIGPQLSSVVPAARPHFPAAAFLASAIACLNPAGFKAPGTRNVPMMNPGVP
jgi:hypothetical protein